MTKYQYDKLNRLVAVTDALNQTTSYGYDKLGNMLTTTQSEDAKSWTKSKGYDESGFLTSSTDTGGNQEKLTRNQLGQVAVKTDPNNNISNYIYDELGRGIFKVSVTGSTVLKNVYQFKGFGPSRKEELRNGSNYMTVYNDYNIYGAQTYKATLYDGTVTVVRHEYNDQNQIKNVADAFDYFTNYSYDKTRINKVQTNGSHIVTAEDNANAQYSFNPEGKLQRIVYPRLSDGSYLTSDYNYDGIGRLVKVSNKKGTTLISEFSYTYDNNGNIISIKDSVGTTNYQYDKLNRLIQVKRPSGETIVYTYDARGNRKTLKGDSKVVDTKEQTYTFNLWDQVSKVVKENTTTEFEYEMQGLRLAKTTTRVQQANSDQNSNSQNPASSVEKVRYAYNNAGKVISEADANNKAIANYTWGPDRLLAKRDVSTNKKYFYLYNGHGDVVQLIDESGQIVNHYQYDEWGNIVEQEETVRNDFKYAGEIFDDETGLYYLRARYYDPAIGRFVSKDTYEGQINNPLTLNLFTYVHNSPLIYTDPSGHWAFVIPAIEAAMPYVIGAVTVLTGIKVGVDINNKGVNGFDTYQSKPTIIQQPRVKAKTQVITTPPITKKKVTVSQQPKVKQGPIVSQQPIIKQKPVVVQVRGPHNWGNRATLPRHVRDHGSDFNITSQDEYAYRANEFFLNRGRYRVKTDENGIIKVYEPQTNTFGAYNPDGTTKTFFKPTSPTYWQRQRGR